MRLATESSKMINEVESSGENHCFLCTLVFKHDILKLWNLLERGFTTYIWNFA